MRLCNWHATLNFGYSSSGCFKPQLYCRFSIILFVRFFSLFFFKYSATKDVFVFCVLESPYIACFQNCLNIRFYHDYNYSERPATVCCEQPRKKVYLVLKKSRKVAVFIYSVAQWLCLYSYTYYLKSYLKSYYSCAVADFQALITWLSRQVLIVISKAKYVLKQVQKISHLPWKEAGSLPQLRGCQIELFLRLHKHGSNFKFAGF